MTSFFQGTAGFAMVALTSSALSTSALADSATSPQIQPQTSAWSSVWMAAPQAVWTDTTVFPTGLPEAIAGLTLRQPLTVSFSASRLRLVLSNLHGTQPLPIVAVSLGLSTSGATVANAQTVLFGGQAQVEIPPGAQILSDPVALPVSAAPASLPP